MNFKIMKKILLVEDNEDNRDMLSRRLELKGFVVVLAVDGQQALDRLDKIGVDNIDPNTPPLEMVNVPPVISSIASLFSTALFA